MIITSGNTPSIHISPNQPSSAEQNTTSTPSEQLFLRIKRLLSLSAEWLSLDSLMKMNFQKMASEHEPWRNKAALLLNFLTDEKYVGNAYMRKKFVETICELLRSFPLPYVVVQDVIHNDTPEVALRFIKNFMTDVNVRYGKDEFTLLHLAARTENAELVAHVLSLKPDVNARTSNGLTPLHHAASAPIVDPENACIKLLLDAGADLLARDDHDKPPFDFTWTNNLDALCNYRDSTGRTIIEKAQAEGNSALLDAYSHFFE